MGFKQRERTRRKKATMASAQSRARSAGASSRWWLTIVTSATCCARCATILREGSAMVYRAQPREGRCVACADSDPVVRYRPSGRSEEHRQRAMRMQSRRTGRAARA